jgi:hypothetical protein
VFLSEEEIGDRKRHQEHVFTREQPCEEGTGRQASGTQEERLLRKLYLKTYSPWTFRIEKCKEIYF